MLNRSKIHHKVDAEKDAKKIYIFCEGDKEVNYFKFFKGFSSNIDIIPVPNNNKKSDPQKLYENAKLQIVGTDSEKPRFSFRSEFGDEVWFVIDTDEWNIGNKINNLKGNCSNQNNWFLTQSNPSFEIWLYFHFHSACPDISEVKLFKTFKEFVDNKIPGGFNPKKHTQIFQLAIINAENNFESENGQPKFLSTEVFNLAKSILPFIKETIDSLIKVVSSA